MEERGGSESWERLVLLECNHANIMGNLDLDTHAELSEALGATTSLAAKMASGRGFPLSKYSFMAA